MKIGITGGIGSGKSYICDIISSMGYPVYDCDVRAKVLMTSDNELKSGLTTLIGTNAYNEDGTINKELVAKFLFENKENAAKINGLVHPAVKHDFTNWATEQKSPLVFMESAILFESGFNDVVDLTITVSAPLETRIKRAIQRDNTSKEKVEARIRQQMPDKECQRRADYRIINDGYSDVHEQIIKIIKDIAKTI